MVVFQSVFLPVSEIFPNLLHTIPKHSSMNLAHSINLQFIIINNININTIICLTKDFLSMNANNSIIDPEPTRKCLLAYSK